MLSESACRPTGDQASLDGAGNGIDGVGDLYGETKLSLLASVSVFL